MDALPPVANLRRLKLELRLTWSADRPDALQVAWAAYLEGRDAATAVNTWRQSERRCRRREVPATDAANGDDLQRFADD